MRLFKFIFATIFYCLFYICMVNLSASAINNKMETLNLKELTSIDGMISGQNDIITFIVFKLENTDTEEIKKQVLKELQNLKSE